MAHQKEQATSKSLSWMKNYTSRQIAPKLYREDTGLACTDQSFGEEEKGLEKSSFHNK